MDLSNAAEIRTELLAVINRGPTVMIADMSATDSCDHSGAEAVARAYRRAMVSGTDLRLVITSQTVRREIKVSGLDWLVPVYHCLEQALASREAGRAGLTTGPTVPARAGTAGQPAASGDAGPPVTEEGPAGQTPPDPDVGTEIALLDRHGVIVSVNHAWQAFATANHGDPSRTGPGASYLEACAAAGDDPVALDVAAAIRQALEGDLPCPLTIEVPCHSPDNARWFDMLISTRLDDDGQHRGPPSRWPWPGGGRWPRRRCAVTGPGARRPGPGARRAGRAESPPGRGAGREHESSPRAPAVLCRPVPRRCAGDAGRSPGFREDQDAVTDLDQGIRELRSFLLDQPRS